MDAEKVKHLPVVDDLGRLIGIVSRGDLLKVHLRPDDDIRNDIETDVLHRVPGGHPVRITTEVADGVVTMAGKVDRASTAGVVARMIRQVPGVVAVVDNLTFEYDDSDALGTGIGYGAA
jgi:osmotically-inducible protein OsmY